MEEAGEDRAPDGDQPVEAERRAGRPDLDADHPAVRVQLDHVGGVVPLGGKEPEDEVGAGGRLPRDQRRVGVDRLEEDVREAEGDDRAVDERERPVERLRHAPRPRDREVGERHVRDLPGPEIARDVLLRLVEHHERLPTPAARKRSSR